MENDARMCGIWCCIGSAPTKNTNLWVNALSNRGPEATEVLTNLQLAVPITMGFTRLAINGLDTGGMQPMTRNGITWMCNGEIYNWVALAAQYGIRCKSGSDCEVLGPLYDRFCDLNIPLAGFFRALDGVFAICIVDAKRNRVVVGRDPYGVRPLYTGYKPLTVDPLPYTPVVIASELKALLPLCESVTAFEPGCYHSFTPTTSGILSNEFIKYHATLPIPLAVFQPGTPLEYACTAVRKSMESAVHKRMMTDRPVAALLSGGLDSSLVAALAASYLRVRGKPPLKTFSIGFRGSTDLAYARKVASWIGSDHTEVMATPDEFFRAIGPVIQAIESFDTTTVRASVGNWLVAKAVRTQTTCKVVFNGDGSDEIWGSYMYFYNAPSDHAYEEEVTRLLTDIHLYDVLRSDRCISSHGLEPRTPFLDKHVVATARAVPTELRRPVRGFRPEKWLLRKAFEGQHLLPNEVLWRKKEAFSDGVSGLEKSWFEILQEKVKQVVPTDWRAIAERLYGSHLCPQTAEQFYYRQLYEGYYGKGTVATNVPYFWMPRWCPGATDPSARTLDVYSKTGTK